MATKKIFGVSEDMVLNRLMKIEFKVHIEFMSIEVYNKALSFGFEKDKWEERNSPNKVLVR
jgi:hypothetical protein